MYDFHYHYMKKKYGLKAQLLFTDTDSLCYEVKTDDIYRDMAGDRDLFDFSGYPIEHPCYDATNKKVIGKMKDETASVPIKEFVGLRAKMYRAGACELNLFLLDDRLQAEDLQIEPLLML